MNDPISTKDQEMIDQDMALLLKHLPPQYILGYADFYGHRLKVTKDTLIPRPETEELVQLCLDETSDERLDVVDIGTGTGAIAISLKAKRSSWNVDICFYHGDTLAPVSAEKFDIIISNPPYISIAEWDLMDESVRTYEPKMALFAEDQGLAIYKKIAKEAKDLLKSKGKIFLEIGFTQGAAVKRIFEDVFPDKKVRIRKDLFGNERMIIVTD